MAVGRRINRGRTTQGSESMRTAQKLARSRAKPKRFGGELDPRAKSKAGAPEAGVKRVESKRYWEKLKGAVSKSRKGILKTGFRKTEAKGYGRRAR
jgi:hypothetical protein